MRLHKLNSSGVAHILALGLVVVGVGIIGAYTIVKSHAATIRCYTAATTGPVCRGSEYPPTPPSTALRFEGTITQDGCIHLVGDIGCSMTVDGRTVDVRHGNAASMHPQPWGQLINFPDIASQNYTGQRAEVYAARINASHYTLQGSASYYVKLLTTVVKPTPGTISGSIVRSFACGVNSRGACTSPMQLYQATVDIYKTGSTSNVTGQIVTSFTSDSKGKFNLSIIPGSYVLVPRKYDGGMTTASTQAVTVKASQNTAAYIWYYTNTP